MRKVLTFVIAASCIIPAASGYAASQVKKQHSVPAKHHKKIVKTAAVDLSASPSSASKEADTASTAAASGLTGTFDITSNYLWRGISQTNNAPAFQGGLTYTFPGAGLYVSTWGSNVNFPDPRGKVATLEMDAILGFANSIGDHFTYNIYVDRYNYPKSSASYVEGVAQLSYYFLTGQYGYSSNVYNFHKTGQYYNIGFKFDIPSRWVYMEGLNFSGGYGHYSLPRSVGLLSYNDYNLQLIKTITSTYSVGIQWTDTNRRSADLPSRKNNHLLATITAIF